MVEIAKQCYNTPKYAKKNIVKKQTEIVEAKNRNDYIKHFDSKIIFGWHPEDSVSCDYH